MGYEPEDLPWEVPLIELGLDSLMAVRIKNRVEYDFDLPPIQLTAVRDANLYAVEKLIEYAIEHRDEVQDSHEHQKALTPEEIAAEQAGAAGRARPSGRASAKLRACSGQAADIPPPPTDPAGPNPAAADGSVRTRGEVRLLSRQLAGHGGPHPGGRRRGARRRRPAA